MPLSSRYGQAFSSGIAEFDSSAPDASADGLDLGILEIDYESGAWVDCYGDEIHDSKVMRRDNPDGFMWDYCEGNAAAPGCAFGQHKKPSSTKRARLAVPKQDSSDGRAKRAKFESPFFML